jgi:hypothetical protein
MAATNAITGRLDMELHRGSGSRKLALKGMVAGLAGLAVAALGLVLGGPAGGAMLVGGSVIGGFILLVALVVFAYTLRPFRIAMSESGLIVNSEGQRFDGPWSQVEAIGIERLMTEEERYALVLWVRQGVPMRNAPTFPPTGARDGHVLCELSDIKESRDEIARALHHYAGTKFRYAARAQSMP